MNDKSIAEGEPTGNAKPGGFRIYRIFKRAILVGLGGLVLLLVAGYFYETSELNRIAKELPPPGELIDIGGRDLHLWIQGEGSPVVVLESGVGGGSLDWTLVAPEIAKFTRVVSYDRAGLGWSDASVNSPTARLAVEDLRKALQAKQIEGPFVLVGHSLGGFHVRMFYYLHPEEVSGIVFVDSSHEEQEARLPKEFLAKMAEIEQTLAVSSKLSTVGITRSLMNMQGGGALFPELDLLPESAQTAWMAMAPSQTQLQAVVHEFEAIEKTIKQVEEAAIPLGEMPLTVLTAAGELPFDLGDSYSDVWMELQVELASRSSTAKHRVINDSGHYIHIDRPDVVIEEVRSIVESYRDSD